MAKNTGGIAQLAPVKSTNLHEKVYSQLRQAIMSGKFKPGESVTLRAMAAALGTSIMPVRDAVLRLVTEHALHSSGRKVTVPVLTLDELRDVERFRVALEGEAAALAAERATEQEIVAIRQAAARVAKVAQSGRIDRFLTENQAFHFTVYRAAHNELLQSMIEKLWLQIGPHLGHVLEYLQRGEISDIVDMGPHERLVEAIASGDAKGARAALAADLEDSTDIYGPYLDQPLAKPAA